MQSKWHHSRERNVISTKRKVVKDNETHGMKATISKWNNIIIQLNFALWLIDWMPTKSNASSEKFCGRFTLPPQPFRAL